MAGTRGKCRVPSQPNSYSVWTHPWPATQPLELKPAAQHSTDAGTESHPLRTPARTGAANAESESCWPPGERYARSSGGSRTTGLPRRAAIRATRATRSAEAGTRSGGSGSSGAESESCRRRGGRRFSSGGRLRLRFQIFSYATTGARKPLTINARKWRARVRCAPGAPGLRLRHMWQGTSDRAISPRCS